MRLRWLACGAFFFGVLGCGSSPDGSALSRPRDCTQGSTCGPSAGGSSESGGAGGALIGSGGIIPIGGSGGVSGSFNTGGFSISTGGFIGLPDGSIGTGGQGGAVGVCPVGRFSGPYEGMYGSLIGMNPVNGNIEFNVDANGSVTGKYTGTTPNNNSKADLVGTLDCSTLHLTMNVENGTYTQLLVGMVKFSGTMPGTYSPDTRSFTGTWSLSDTSGSNNSGTGTWAAQ